MFECLVVDGLAVNNYDVHLNDHIHGCLSSNYGSIIYFMKKSIEYEEKIFFKYH